MKKVITMMAKQMKGTLKQKIRTAVICTFTALTVLTSGPIGCIKSEKSSADSLLEMCKKGKHTIVMAREDEDGIRVTQDNKPVVARVLYYFGIKPSYNQSEKRKLARKGDTIVLCPTGTNSAISNPHYKPPHIDENYGYVDPTNGRKNGETTVTMEKME